jgi:hypothetical protein
MGLNSDLHSLDMINSNSSNWDLLPSDFEAVIGSSSTNYSNSNPSTNSANSWSDMSPMKSDSRIMECVDKIKSCSLLSPLLKSLLFVCTKT